MVDAIRVHLQQDLVGDDALTEREPPLSVRCVCKKRPDRHQAGRVAEAVIAIDIGGLEVARDELAMDEERSQHPPAESIIGAGMRLRHERKAPNPADRTQRHVHRARPVDAIAQRIYRQPVIDLLDKLACVVLIVAEPIRLSEGGEMPGRDSAPTAL